MIQHVSSFLPPDNLYNRNFQKLACSPQCFWMQAAKTFLKLDVRILHCSWILLCGLHIKINVEKERMVQVKNITWKPIQRTWTELYLVYYPTWQQWVPAAFANSEDPSETHRKIICPGALAYISNAVRDWFKSWSKVFSVFPIFFISSDKPIWADCYSTVLLEKCHICGLSKYWMMFSALRQSRGNSSDILGMEGNYVWMLPSANSSGEAGKASEVPW